MMKYINISNVYQRQYRGEKRNYMTQLQFFIGWLLLTIILFALDIHFKMNREIKKNDKAKYLALIKMKFLNIIITIIKIAEKYNDKTTLDFNYIGKIEYRDNDDYSEIVSLYFLVSIIDSAKKILFSIYKDSDFNSNPLTSFIAYESDKTLFNRKLSKVEKELLISLGLLEDMNIESSRVSVSVSGKFISDINNIDITDTELENLDLVQL